MYLFVYFQIFSALGRSTIDAPKSVELGLTDTVYAYLQQGGDVDSNRSSDGDTMLILASKMGHYEVVKLLLNHGANTNLVNKLGMSALAVASSNGHGDVVNLLIESGANVNQRSAKRGANKGNYTLYQVFSWEPAL